MSYSGINKNVFSKLPKQEVELSSEKVELGLVDDLDGILKRMKAIDSQLMKSVQKLVNALSAFSKVQKELDDSYAQSQLDKEDAQSDLNSAVKVVTEISKKAKELGIDPKGIKGMSDVVSISENIEDTIAILDRNEPDAKKILSI